MIDPRIKYYPVGNGDTSLITLSDETKIIIDINITEESLDENNNERFNVIDDLLNNELKREDEIPFVDVFILSHPDDDHCHGFIDNFYQGSPDDYDDEDNKLIRINELWYSPRLFSEYKKDLNEEALAFKEEAERRMNLYKEGSNEFYQDGNRIRIVGYSDDEELEGLEDRIIVPGNVIDTFNDDSKDDFELFIHAPFKDYLDEDDRNDSSIVFQARFKVDEEENACLALWGGDAGWKVWEEILEKSDENDLKWDLFLAPHHCSWGYFNDNTEEGKKEPKESSLDILDKRNEGNPKVIVSSKELKRNGDNPPSYKAKNQYVSKVEEKNFLVIATDSDTKPPEPIEFEISSNGPCKIQHTTSNKTLKSSLITKAASTPKTYGKTI